jgi:hypothetical protein
MKAKTTIGLLLILIGWLSGSITLTAKDTGKNNNSRAGKISEYMSRHINSKDISLIDSSYLHGYMHNIVKVNVNGEQLKTLSIQCTDNSIHVGGGRTGYSVWTRDLYWGFLGWAQAGDDSVLDLMKSSLRVLIAAKNKNQALGLNKMWPLNDKRFYIPQAYDQNLVTAKDFFPWCSESQADFLLLAYNYWKLSGDTKFIESIWSEIVYVTKTLELLDTDGNSLPDALWGSYDYMFISSNTEEPLMCAKTSFAFSSVSKLAVVLGKDTYAARLEKLAAKIKETMNKPVEEGGLWKKEGNGGYRNTLKGEEKIEDKFIPYDNLVPMWCGMTNSQQDKAIFEKLDANFKDVYDLMYGPMYCAVAGHNDKSVMNCSSVTWLAFLDVYLRGKKDHETNRTKIYSMLMLHAHDAGGIVFPEGAGVYGSLTGGAGRAWDNGNFFHMLVCGIYGLEKSNDGITISAPEKIEGVPLTELKNFYLKKAVYDFTWTGNGKNIKSISVDGQNLKQENGGYTLKYNSGKHKVIIQLYQ